MNLQTEFYRLHFLVPPFGWWLHANHLSVQAHLPRGGVRSVLEVGGGLGRLAFTLGRRYLKAEVLSIDISPEMHRIANDAVRLPNVRFQLVDFLAVEGRYDLVVSAGCWEFLDREAGAAQLARLLAPDGTVVINTLRPTAFSRAHARLYARRYQAGITLHEPEALAACLARHGLRAGWTPVNPREGSYTLVARF